MQDWEIISAMNEDTRHDKARIKELEAENEKLRAENQALRSEFSERESVVCVECSSVGAKSTVIQCGIRVTAMGHLTFYDENGVYHHHNQNWHTMLFVCSYGHQWEKKYLKRCPAPGCTFGQ